MNENILVPIEQAGQRVLLTSQLAESYETFTHCRLPPYLAASIVILLPSILIACGTDSNRSCSDCHGSALT